MTLPPLADPALRFAERLRGARKRRALSLRALAAQVGVSAQALSKYERGQSMPSSDVLIRLAQALGVTTEWLLRPAAPITLSLPQYRAHRARPRQKARAALLEQVRDWLERYFDIEAILGRTIPFTLEGVSRRIEAVEEAEAVAEALRQAWGLGMDAIPNLTATLEAHGVYVGEVAAEDGFDALTVWADETKPVMVVRRGVPGDRQRFSLAHELGHLVLALPSDWPDRTVEAAASRFAAAFLVPRATVTQELGEHRAHLSLGELHTLKHRYGLSMSAWVRRAQDVGVIAPKTATRLQRLFRARGWHRAEPGVPYPSEAPQRMRQLVLRALAEEEITERKAKRLLDIPLWMPIEAMEKAGADEPIVELLPA